MERISVIIPVYNAASTLPATVRAVLAQTYADLELLLINDGSTDGSGAVCDGFADPRVRVFHRENGGVSAARNLGLSQAAGEYITFLDADDIVPADYLQVLYDACRNADIAVCDVVSIQDDREKARFTHPDAVLTQREALDFLLTRRRINSGPCAKLFRREMLQGLTFPPLKAYEDILFVREAFCHADHIAVTDRTEYRYIQNPAGAMSRFFKAPSPDIIRATDALLEFIGGRPDLSPDCFYITASHLMQYAMPAAQNPEGRDFVLQSRKLYRKYWRQLLACPAFPWKEKIVFSLFILGWMYTGHNTKRIGG
jgi:glycosyltransferase involved in cell wall biosynthesis